jgi:hypothetical protein
VTETKTRSKYESRRGGGGKAEYFRRIVIVVVLSLSVQVLVVMGADVGGLGSSDVMRPDKSGSNHDSASTRMLFY